MKVCPQCEEVADLNKWGICEGCQFDNDENENLLADAQRDRDNGELA